MFHLMSVLQPDNHDGMFTGSGHPACLPAYHTSNDIGSCTVLDNRHTASKTPLSWQTMLPHRLVVTGAMSQTDIAHSWTSQAVIMLRNAESLVPSQVPV